VQEFALDGDIQPEEAMLPPVEGYAQSVLRLTRRNDFNMTIVRAANYLRGEVSDSSLAAQLDRVVFALGKQEHGTARMRRRRLPARHRRWRDLLLLAEQIIAGLGMDYSDSAWLTGPGFVVRTADAWETLVFEALRLGSGSSASIAKTSYALGSRWRGGDARVTPDVTLSPFEGATPILIDAKYKTAGGKGAHVAPADLYEALAFMKASATATTLLVYPGTPQNSTGIPGAFAVFDRISVGDRNVFAATVEISGISERRGLGDLSRGLATAALTFVDG
jgi:5-methylcytosine-specific restriction enzyme subunit McrC